MHGLTPRVWACFLCLLLLGAIGQALAHAVIVTAQPPANAKLTDSTFSIDLKFNSRVDYTRSRLALIDAKGQARVLELSDPRAKDRLQSQATDVAPGKYRLEWYVLSADGHITRGNLRLEVLQAE
jgi:copper resistance protein C